MFSAASTDCGHSACVAKRGKGLLSAPPLRSPVQLSRGERRCKLRLPRSPCPAEPGPRGLSARPPRTAGCLDHRSHRCREAETGDPPAVLCRTAPGHRRSHFPSAASPPRASPPRAPGRSTAGVRVVAPARGREQRPHPGEPSAPPPPGRAPRCRPRSGRTRRAAAAAPVPGPPARRRPRAPGVAPVPEAGGSLPPPPLRQPRAPAAGGLGEGPRSTPPSPRHRPGPRPPPRARALSAGSRGPRPRCRPAAAPRGCTYHRCPCRSRWWGAVLEGWVRPH